MPSPIPLPKKVLEMRGSWRAKHRQELGIPCNDLPDPPDFLRERAAHFFMEAVRSLDEMGVLAKTDIHTVIRYATTLDRWYTAEEELAKTGIHYIALTGRDGEQKACKPSPAMAQANICHDQLKQLEATLGFTPGDRARLGTSPPQPKAKTADPMKAVLGCG